MALLLAAATAGAQGLISLGIKAGATVESTKYSGKNAQPNYKLEPDSRMGFHVGVVGRLNLAIFHVQPEIIYTRSGYNIDALSKSGIPGVDRVSETKIRTNRLDMPILAGLRLAWFRFQAGPVFSLMTDASAKGGDFIDDIDISRPTVSFMAGVGFDIGKINLDVRYHGNFNRYENGISFNGVTNAHVYKSRHNSWLFSVGYLF